ncbi:MAG: hypothetical protein HYS56_04930 [Candidatus Omnitrophica bacterium]|nr:hypothetical protein [Candidatus Omnitrophota bacterium]
MAIPEFDSKGLLPEGVYPCNEKEFLSHFGFNVDRRQLIVQGLFRVTRYLVKRQVKQIFIGGSVITKKPFPADIDAYVVLEWRNPLFAEIILNREEWRKIYSVDLNAAQPGEGPLSEMEWRDFFTKARGGESVRGIIQLKLGGDCYVSDQE